MKIALLSDIHGFIPKVNHKKADYIILAGDICPDYIVQHQYDWYIRNFVPWLKDSPPCLFIPGNHDFIFEHFTPSESTYLTNGFHTLSNGMKAYCFCYTICPGWAFNKTDKEMEPLLTNENDFDILVTHNPPAGICDRLNDGHHIGSKSILGLVDRVKPKIVVTAHIHESYGSKWYNDTLCLNVAFKDRRYQPRYKYPVLDTDDLSVTFVNCEEYQL